MAWTAPRTWIAGEVVTASLMNTHVRDNLAYLATPPSVRCYNSAAQTLTNNTDTALTLNTTRWDDLPSGLTTPQHSGSSTHLTCRADGKYHIFCNAVFASGGTGSRSLAIRINGTTNRATETYPNDGVVVVRCALSTIWSLVDGDYVELVGYQDSGGNLNIITEGGVGAEFGWQWLGF
jgi:hypothetical protein